MTLELVFHEYGLNCGLMFALIEEGPSSMNKPVMEEHPGPPLSHNVTGSLCGSFRDSKNPRER